MTWVGYERVRVKASAIEMGMWESRSRKKRIVKKDRRGLMEGEIRKNRKKRVIPGCSEETKGPRELLKS